MATAWLRSVVCMIIIVIVKFVLFGLMVSVDLLSLFFYNRADSLEIYTSKFYSAY